MSEKEKSTQQFSVSEDQLFPLIEEKYRQLKCAIFQEKDLNLNVVRVGAEEFWSRLVFYFMAGAKLKLYKIKTCS